MKSPVLTDLVHFIHIRIIQTISGEITSSDLPGTQSYISELYRTYMVKSPVLTDLIHNHTSIIETLSGEITSSDRPGTHYTYHNYTDHIWWNHLFWPTWYTIIHQLLRPYLVKSPVLTDLLHNHTYQNYTEHIWWNHHFWLTWYTIIHQL